MTKYIKNKNGKFAGSIGDGKTRVPTAARRPLTASDKQELQKAVIDSLAKAGNPEDVTNATVNYKNETLTVTAPEAEETKSIVHGHLNSLKERLKDPEEAVTLAVRAIALTFVLWKRYRSAGWAGVAQTVVARRQLNASIDSVIAGFTAKPGQNGH